MYVKTRKAMCDVSSFYGNGKCCVFMRWACRVLFEQVFFLVYKVQASHENTEKPKKISTLTTCSRFLKYKAFYGQTSLLNINKYYLWSIIDKLS